MARGPFIARAIAAFVFVALFAAVLTIPVRNSDTGAPEPEIVRRPTESPNPTPSRSRSRKPIPDRFRLAEPYPDRCLRPVASPVPGQVAAYDHRRVTITTIDGTVRAVIRGRAPVGWSASGRFLAVGRWGGLWNSDGTRVRRNEYPMRIGPGWAWSPVADCAVRVAKNGALFSTVVNPSKIPPVWGTTLANRGVESFAFSPDGSKLGLVLGSRRNRAIAIADLHTRSVEVVRRFRFPTCCISLGGWTPDSRFLLYWAASGASVAADGSPLEGIAMDGERIDLTPVKGKRFSSLARVTVPRPDALETCGDRLVGVLGGARFLVEATQITTLYPLTAKGPISTGDFSDVDPSCSESGELMAVARGEVKRRSGVRLERWLVLLDASARGGQAVRNLTPVGGPSEESSEWGPPGTGSIFVQRAGDDAELWYLAEGARAPQPVGVRVVDRWSSWDWSATPPTGLPAGQ